MPALLARIPVQAREAPDVFTGPKRSGAKPLSIMQTATTTSVR